MELVREWLALAFRGIRRSPGFTTAVVVLLALGVGLNAATFGVVDRLLLSAPQHVVQGDRVVRSYLELVSPFTQRHALLPVLSWPDFQDLRSVPGFEATASFHAREMTLGSGAEAERVRTLWVEPEFFPLLGVAPEAGRFFAPEEDAAEGGPPVAVLSHAYWMRRFGGDANVLGEALMVGRQRYTVVGVAPRGFTGATLDPVDLVLPLSRAAAAEQGTGWVQARDWTWLSVVARLREGTSLEAAADQATAAHRAGRELEIRAGRYDAGASVVLASVIPGQDPYAGPEVHAARWVGGVALLVLLIACANVANLLLLRSARRRGQTAVRLALGIGRGRLAGQWITEVLVLAVLAGAAAFAVAGWGGALLYRTLAPDLDPGAGMSGPRVMVFTAAVTLAASMVAGLFPAVLSTRQDLVGYLRGSDGGPSGGRVRSTLVMCQVALSVVLLTGAGLFLRSLGRVADLNLGFQPAGLVVGSVEATGGNFGGVADKVLAEAALSLRTSGVVEDAALASAMPFRGLWTRAFTIDGGGGVRDSVALSEGPYVYAVSENYFDVLQMPLVRGRAFTAADRQAGAAPVAILTESLSRTAFGQENPLGRCIMLESDSDTPTCTTVVGILGDHHVQDLREGAAPAFYLPLGNPAAARYPALITIARAREGEAAAALATVRGALLNFGADVRYARVQRAADILGARSRSWRAGATLFSLFGLLAAGVTAVGLHAVLAFDVTQRRGEMGLRAALGADSRRLLWLVVHRGARLAGSGVVVGVLVSLAAAGLIEGFLFQVRARDPVMLTLVAMALLVVAVLASALPAVRAARVAPTEALRER